MTPLELALSIKDNLKSSAHPGPIFVDSDDDLEDCMVDGWVNFLALAEHVMSVLSEP